jgi:hypothetical protein
LNVCFGWAKTFQVLPKASRMTDISNNLEHWRWRGYKRIRTFSSESLSQLLPGCPKASVHHYLVPITDKTLTRWWI